MPRNGALSCTTEPREEQIFNRAYKIWKAHGKPGGRGEEFWHIACEELLREAEAA